MTLQVLGMTVLLSMTIVGCTRGHKDCQSVQSVRDRILEGHISKTTTGRSFERCTIDCERESDCFSINYLTVEATCQMNNTTVKVYPADFVPWAGGLYMDSLVRQYESNPCNDRIPPCDGFCVLETKHRQAIWTICVCMQSQTSNCQPDACKPAALGMESGEIKKGQITSSSTHIPDTNDWGRLNYNIGSWTPSTDALPQWYQVSFELHSKVFTQIATQGNGLKWWWVTDYSVDFKRGLSPWQSYSENGRGQTIFKGNIDRTSTVKNAIKKPFIADTIKIKPLRFTGRIALRIELYGCNVD